MARFVYDGEVQFDNKVAIDFNGRFFFDTINAISDDKILFKFSEPLAPMVFDSGSFEDQKAILTPLSRR
jgi:DNA polymerase III sliding clamp (beta) subunit (PCNA family)